MGIRLDFLLVVKLVRLTGTRFGGAVAKMYHGVLGLACRILNDDYVTGYTVDDDFYSVAFAMHAARVLLMLTP